MEMSWILEQHRLRKGVQRLSDPALSDGRNRALCRRDEPARSFTNVLFPTPFVPTIAVSPGVNVHEISMSAVVPVSG